MIEECPLEIFESIEKKLIERFNGDPEVCDLPRIMRLPGFFHQKKEPILVRAIQYSKNSPYKLTEFLKAFQIDLYANIATYS